MRPEEGVKSHGTVEDYEPSGWDSNLYPLKEQPVLFIVKQSLQSLVSYFNYLCLDPPPLCCAQDRVYFQCDICFFFPTASLHGLQSFVPILVPLSDSRKQSSIRPVISQGWASAVLVSNFL